MGEKQGKLLKVILILAACAVAIVVLVVFGRGGIS